jgi:type VI secretion system protein ImpH
VEFEGRSATAALIEMLREDAPRYSFFQIAQLAEAAGAGEIGGRGPVSEEQLRFRTRLSMAHPASDVTDAERVEDAEGRERLLLETTFLGLYGTASPLPSYFTEDLLHEENEDSLVRGFLDIFHHRMISLFYRCWKKYRHHVQFSHGGQDAFSKRLLSLTGLNIDAGGAQSKIPPIKLLRYAGVLSQRPCSAASLRCILADYYSDVPIKVNENVARWVTIPDESRCRLGFAGCTLGQDTQLGERVYDRYGKFRVELGPMELDRFENFLPEGKDAPILRQLLRIATADLLAYDVQLDLVPLATPTAQLSAHALGAKLGQTSWLGSAESKPCVLLQSYGDKEIDPSQLTAAPDGAASIVGA